MTFNFFRYLTKNCIFVSLLLSFTAITADKIVEKPFVNPDLTLLPVANEPLSPLPDSTKSSAEEELMKAGMLLTLAGTTLSTGEMLAPTGGYLRAQALIYQARKAFNSGKYALAASSACNASNILEGLSPHIPSIPRTGPDFRRVSLFDLQGRNSIQNAGGRAASIWTDDLGRFRIDMICSRGYSNRFKGSVLSNAMIKSESLTIQEMRGNSVHSVSPVHSIQETSSRITFDETLQGGVVSCLAISIDKRCKWILIDILMDGTRHAEWVRIGEKGLKPAQVPVMVQLPL